MYKLILTNILFFYFCSLSADEGMWLPTLDSDLFKRMKDMGLELSFDDFYNEKSPCLANTIVSFGGTCSGSVVSKSGLVMTNYHCGNKYLNQLVSGNLESKGFYAETLSDELPSPGLTVRFLKKMIDITECLLSDVEQDGLLIDKNDIIAKRKKDVLTKYKKLYPGFKQVIKEINAERKYLLCLYEEFLDVRIVYMPPVSIGKFGGNQDNWTWPRYTGDFAFFRIYADKENRPAHYSVDNVPYKPSNALTFSSQGYSEGDFSMIIGFPGYTEHLIYSGLLRNYLKMEVPMQYQLLRLNREVVEQSQFSDNRKSRYSSLLNQETKLLKIMNLENMDSLIVERKLYEQHILDALGPSVEGDTLKMLFSSYLQIENDIQAYINPYLCYALGFSNVVAFQWVEQLKSSGIINMEDGKSLRSQNNSKVRFKDYDVNADKILFANLLKFYHAVCDTSFYFPFKNDIRDWQQWCDELYLQSLFSSKDSLLKYLEYDPVRLKSDPMFIIINQMTDLWGAKLWSNYPSLLDKQRMLNQKYYKLLSSLKIKEWPDANGTMRLSYGTVKGEGVDSYATYMSQILKHPDAIADKLPSELRVLYEDTPFSESFPVCFMTDCHTTSGSSGSPVLNAKGELIGLNFDRNEVGTIGDYIYNDKFRSIILDVRYILFVLDKYAKCERLMNELIIK